MNEAHDTRGRFAQVQEEPLNCVLQVRMSVSDLAHIREQADAAGTTPSALARQWLRGQTVITQTDLAVIRELRRLGGLLKLTHQLTGGAMKAEATAAIRNLNAYVEVLIKNAKP